MKRAIISLDTDHIKKYVFATGTLKEIRGASAILDELNRKKMMEIVKENDSSAECIFANGGSGMFKVDADKAETCISQIKKCYRSKTATGSVSGAELSDKKFSENFGEAFKVLSYRLRMEKDAGNLSVKPVTHPFLRICDSCGVEYAGYTGEENELLCLSCKVKRKKDWNIKDEIEALILEKKTPEKHKLWDRLLSGYHTKGHRPEDFNQLGSLSSPTGYIGLLYADGDGMGKKLEKLNSQEELKTFSQVADNGIFHAASEAIQKHLQPKPKSPYFPFDILLLGGDDLVMATVADKAIEVAMTIVDTFQKYTEKRLEEPLTVSVGVAIAHAKFPFRNLLNMAEDLLKFAKKEGASRARNSLEKNGQGGLINFQVVSASNSIHFSEDYKNVFVHKIKGPVGKSRKMIRTLRPYDIQTMMLLVKKIQEMKSFPRNKIQALQEAVFLDYADSLLYGLVIQNRLKREQRQLLRETLHAFSKSDDIAPLPWFERGDEYHTPFSDIAELYDFIQ